MSSVASTMGSDGKLETDRYGVPQFAGEGELLEEYVVGAWDLFYGREGHARRLYPLQLRAQLSGTAFEAVRKLDHSKLRTKDENGKATDEGMKLLLKCLQDSLAQEAPVRTQELFLEYFCSPQVWRKNLESMAQHIIRRELAFAKLRESSTEAQLSDNLKCMLLLIFSGLDLKEQQGILASVNNEYDYKKISHALRIQFPSAASTRPVVRRDYLGAALGDEEAFAEEEIDENDMAGDEIYMLRTPMMKLWISWEIWPLGTLKMKRWLTPLPPVPNTVDSSARSASSRGLQLRAVPILASRAFLSKPKVTWRLTNVPKTNDALPWAFWSPSLMALLVAWRDIGLESPMPRSHPAQRRAAQRSLCRIESDGDDERQIQSNKVVVGSKTLVDVKALDTFAVFDSNEVSAYAKVPDHFAVSDLTEVPEYDKAAKYDMFATNAKVSAEIFGPAGLYGDPNDGRNGFTFPLNVVAKAHDALMALRAPVLCEHSTYHGGDEKQFHHGANGHTRHITCKECGKNGIVGRRCEAVQMWSYTWFRWQCAQSFALVRVHEHLQLELQADHPRARGPKTYDLDSNETLEEVYGIPWRIWWGTMELDSWRCFTYTFSWDCEVINLGQTNGCKDCPQQSGDCIPLWREVCRTPTKIFHNFLTWLTPICQSCSCCLKTWMFLPMDLLLADRVARLPPMPLLSMSAILAGWCTWPWTTSRWPQRSTDLRHTYMPAWSWSTLLPCDSWSPLTWNQLNFLGNKLKILARWTQQGISKSLFSTTPKIFNTSPSTTAMSWWLNQLMPPSPKTIRPCKNFKQLRMKMDLDLTMTFNWTIPVSASTMLSMTRTCLDLQSLTVAAPRRCMGLNGQLPFEQALSGVDLGPSRRRNSSVFVELVARPFPWSWRFSLWELANDMENFTQQRHLDLRLCSARGPSCNSWEQYMEQSLTCPRTKCPARPWMSLTCLWSEHPGATWQLAFWTLETAPTWIFVGSRRTTRSMPKQLWSIKPSEHTAQKLMDHRPTSPRPLMLLTAMLDTAISMPTSVSTHSWTNWTCFVLRLTGILMIRRSMRAWCTKMMTVFGQWPMVSEEGFVVRSTTNKKSKKLETMNKLLPKLLDSDDLMKSRTPQGKTKPKVSHRPPVGKVWIKQIFAGKLGLTLGAVLFGMMVGCPLDSSSSAWDATEPTALARVHKDMAAEDPYLTVITHPCGP